MLPGSPSASRGQCVNSSSLQPFIGGEGQGISYEPNKSVLA